MRSIQTIVDDIERDPINGDTIIIRPDDYFEERATILEPLEFRDYTEIKGD